jgi:CheY-like chemotaxis protein
MKRILVVDDEPAVRHAVSRLLHSVGFAVVAAADETAALQEFEKAEIHLLVTDAVMPKGANGFALARAALQRQPTLKVIHMTGYEMPTDEAMGPVLRKPFSDRALLDAVEDLLRP